MANSSFCYWLFHKLIFYTTFYCVHISQEQQTKLMCSVTEPRRATVSCKHVFSSSTSDRSTPSSSSRRHHNNNSNIKRNTNANSNGMTRSSNYSTKKQQQRLIDTTNDNHFNSNVFHIPFCLEQINDNGKKLLSNNHNNKLLRTLLNPLSPAFFSTRQTSLVSEQKPDTTLRYVLWKRSSLEGKCNFI